MAGNVNKIDTIHFNDTINAYKNHIRQFDSIVASVNNITKKVVDKSKWKGKGRDAFEKDCKQVQQNLQDITDIMYDLRDALINAHAGYMETDEALSKSFDT